MERQFKEVLRNRIKFVSYLRLPFFNFNYKVITIMQLKVNSHNQRRNKLAGVAAACLFTKSLI
ncbi:hypothetical protein DM587_16835 [Vibrio fluvialis]|nr:hypothetical protein DJ016_18410 [Vibrio fluvialis]TRN10032.1 hypothetical protein DM587_16835 [Vibrio fluvialis]